MGDFIQFLHETDPLEKIASSIAEFEGWNQPDSPARRNNNPGNLKNPQTGEFHQFASEDEGWAALKRQIQKNADRGITLKEFFGGKPGVYSGYAPAADNNDPEVYAGFVADRLGVSPETRVADVTAPQAEKPKQGDFAAFLAETEKPPAKATAGFGERLGAAAEYTAKQIPRLTAALTAAVVNPENMRVPGLRQVVQEPLVKPSLLIPEGGPATELGRGIVQGLEGLVSPENIAIGGALKTLHGVAALEKAANAHATLKGAQTAISAYFAKEMGTGAYETGKTAVEAVKAGDFETAARNLGLGSVESLFAVLAGTHAARGTLEAGRDVARRARERVAPKPEPQSFGEFVAQERAAQPPKAEAAPELQPPAAKAPEAPAVGVPAPTPPPPAPARAAVPPAAAETPPTARERLGLGEITQDQMDAASALAAREGRATVAGIRETLGVPPKHAQKIRQALISQGVVDKMGKRIAAPEPEAPPTAPAPPAETRALEPPGAPEAAAAPPSVPEAPAREPARAEAREPQAVSGQPAAAELAGDVVKLPAADIQIDAPRFQYKLGMGEKGVSGKLKGVRVWDRELGGVIHVWRDPANGKVYVVNGHHRVELAQRTGQADLDVRFIQAKNATEARVRGALINIAEGQGTPLDAAKVFRDSKLTQAEIERRGISLTDRIASDGLALANLDGNLFAKVVSGELPETRAVVIGRNLPDHADQRALYETVQKLDHSGKRPTNDQIAEMIRLVPPKRTETQETLFGPEEISRSLIAEKAEVSDYIRKELGSEKRLFGAVGKESAAERLSQSGNVIRAAENLQVSQEANQGLAIYDKLSGAAGPIDATLNRAAEALANGENANAVKQRTYQEIRTELLGQVRKFAGRPERPSERPAGLPQEEAHPARPGELPTAREETQLDAFAQAEAAARERLKRERGILGSQKGALALGRPPARRGTEGFWIAPDGERIAIGAEADHVNLPRFRGKTRQQIMGEGYIRSRGNGVEIADLASVNPAHLRRALQEAAKGSEHVYLDTATGSAIYDAADLEAAGWNPRKVRPLQFFLREDAGTLDADRFRDLATVGAAKLKAGAVKFSAWSRAMVADLGESVKPHLLRIWRAVRRFWSDERGEFDFDGMQKSLFGKKAEAESKIQAKRESEKLEGERLSAEFASPLNRGNLRKKLKPGERPVQTGLFEEAPEAPKQGSLFGSERGSFSGKPTTPKDEAPPYHLKRPTVLGHLANLALKPGGEVIGAQGEWGAALKKQIERYRDEGDVAAGGRLLKLADSGLSKVKQRVDRFRLLDMLEGRAKPEGALGEVAAKLRALTDETADVAEKLHILVQKGEKKVPFKRLANYFPHVIRSVDQLASPRIGKNQIREDVIDSLVWRKVRNNRVEAGQFLNDYLDFVETGARKKSLIDYLVATKQARNELSAWRKLQAWHKRANPKHGSLEFSREVNLPFYDPDPARVLPHWIAEASDRLEMVKVFGQNTNERMAEYIKGIEESGGDADTVRRLTERILGVVNDSPGSRKVSRFLRSMQGFKLGLAAIPNATQTLNTLLYSDLRATLAGIGKAATKQGRRFGVESGASVDSVLNEMMREVGGDFKPLGTFLRAVGFSQTERMNRTIAANAGANYAGRMARRLHLNPRDTRARRTLAELGIDADEVARQKGKLTPHQVLLAAKKLSDITQFRSRPEDLPYFASTPQGKVFFQFKTFGYNQVRLLKRALYDEAAAGSYGRAARNVLLLATVFPLAGEAVADLRALLTGRKRDEKDLGRYFEDMFQTGALGILSDLVQSAEYNKTLEGLVGPAIGTIGEIGQAGLQIVTAKNTRKAITNFGKALFRQVPLAGQLRRRLWPSAFPTKKTARKPTHYKLERELEALR